MSVYKLGEKLRWLREVHKLTPSQVAEILNVSPATINQYENDGIQPIPESLIILANLYETTIEYLLNPDRNPMIVIDSLTSSEKQTIQEINECIIEKYLYNS